MKTILTFTLHHEGESYVDGEDPEHKIEYRCQSGDIPTVLDHFKYFLLAVGFGIDGQLTITDE